MPTPTPTEVAQDPVVPVDELGRAVLRENAIEVHQNMSVRSIRPSPKGDLTAVIFGTEGGDYVQIYDFASGELFPLLRDPESGVSSHVGYFLGWSQDSQFILFRLDTATGYEMNLLVEVGTGYIQSLANLRAHSGTFSPDGQSIILDHEVWERDE